jgi:transposase
MDNVNVIGVDLAKHIFQLHGATWEGKKVFSKKLNRQQVLPFLAQQPACVVAMEACGGAHYWARQIKKLGHDVKMIAAQFVKPFAKNQKNDRNDAQAIAEAASRAITPLVSQKSTAIQDLQCLLRVRERHIKQRTALVNQIRGFLLEYGITLAKGRHQVLARLPKILEDTDTELSENIRTVLLELAEELRGIDGRIKHHEERLKHFYHSNELCQRISQVRGIGLITATSLLAELNDPSVYKNGRHFAAFLGLVPKQNSSGGKTKLGSITKQGNRQIRYLLIHGARAVLSYIDKKDDALSFWLKRIKAEKGVNKAAVALANKNARIIWSMAKYGDQYQVA